MLIIVRPAEWDRMRKPLLGLSMMPEADFVASLISLLQNNSIEVIEWSFDTFYQAEEPEWLGQLLDFYAQNGRLIGHGVYYSLFDAKWTERQEIWLEQLKLEVQKRKYNHITEHFGFMNTDNFHQGVPLPVPLHSKTLQIGKDRLNRLQDSVDIPIGIENLAFSFSINDVKEQGDFIDRLIEDIDGFVILDLHNIYCQSCNFKVNIWELIKLYPLDKVKEVHLSGGSWQKSVYSQNVIRRDTHDDAIPEEIFEILPLVLLECINLEYVIIERLGNAIKKETEKISFFNDFNKTREIIDASEQQSEDKIQWSKVKIDLLKPVEDLLLYEDQLQLTKLLFDSANVEDVKNHQFHYFKTENWDIEMIHTARDIIKKWNPY